MQTVLVLLTLEIPPAQRAHAVVVAPEEIRHDDIEAPGADDLAPDGLGGDVHGGHGREGGEALGQVVGAEAEVDGDHDGAADDAEGEEEVAAHLGEAQEDGGVEADAVDQVLLARAQDGLDPGEEAAADGGRGVLLVGMLELGGVDEGVTGAEEGEEQGQEGGDAEGGAQGGPEGVDLELSQSAVI